MVPLFDTQSFMGQRRAWEVIPGTKDKFVLVLLEFYEVIWSFLNLEKELYDKSAGIVLCWAVYLTFLHCILSGFYLTFCKEY